MEYKCQIVLVLLLNSMLVFSLDDASTSMLELSSTDDLTTRSDLEVDSETPGISFGIKSFTVEVSTATDKPFTSNNVNNNNNNNTHENTTASYDNESETESLIMTSNNDDEDIISTSEEPHSTHINTKLVDDDQISNEIHVEKNLKNGLFRIKIAEITTDEFDNGLHENDNENENEENILMINKVFPNKINMNDFYPSKLEDFKPVIEASNEKLLREKNMLRNEEMSNEEKLSFESTLMKPSELLPIIDVVEQSNTNNNNNNNNNDISTTKIEIELIDDTSETSTSDENVDNLNKKSKSIKLEQHDDVVSKIEENFRVVDDVTTMKPSAFVTTTMRTKINSDFIPRRVKKNDPTAKINIFNSVANTKFNTDTTHDTTDGSKKEKPEFSTTKFYNSKELYSELHHQILNDTEKNTPKKMKIKSAAVVSEKDIMTAKTVSKPIQSIQSIVSTSSAIKKMTKIKLNKDVELKKQILKTNIVPIETPTTTINKPNKNSSEFVTSIQIPTEKTPATSTTTRQATTKAKPKQTSTTTTTTTTSTQLPQMTTPVFIETPLPRPRLLSRLQEKINSLDCDLQNLSPETTVWRGNETHELNLPVTTPEDCSSGADCLPTVISWEGTADIQSGDVLIVEIDDKQLIPAATNKTKVETQHRTTAAVYQVTRLGHEHCDVTEGVLLDITPLVVDGKKLVTLYDKDLTEGINLLIVVSELWGQQCVRLKVTVKSDNCGENADCSGKGVCYSNNSMEGYECQCCSGFAGSHCEEIDACTPSPCTNNGICVDLSQGHEGNAYQCLCPYGYTGKNCQFESDPCNPSQCLNGGTCVGNSTHFRCDCTSGYTGPLCQHNLNECESSPCVHGICVDQEDGFRCFCQPGFSGELCNFEYNECESNPCINGGQCIDNIGGFSCKCTRGYTGKRCHIKVDFCANDPCPDGHRCIDHGDDFTCECPGGRNGPDCNQVPRTLCNVNPCANGGTCWTTEESFYCACRPGFTGKMCEDNFVIDTVVSSSELLSDINSQSIRSYGESAHISKHGSTIELHNAYIAAGTLAAAILIVAVVVTACHCKVHQSYRYFATKHRQLIPYFGRKPKSTNANRHWLSGKGHNEGHNNLNYSHTHQHQHHNAYNLQPDRIINRPLAMNLENDMYYTVDFSDSQNSPLIQ